MNRPATLPSPESFKARFTASEFLRMAEVGAFEGMTVELVGGELERLNPPQTAHAGRQAMVVGQLWAIFASSEIRVMGEVGLELADDMILSCDAALLNGPVAAGRLARPEELRLVVEIAETTRLRDLGMKRIAYAMAGVPVYWVVDGPMAVTHVHAEPMRGDYRRVVTIPFGEPVPVPGSERTIVIA